MINRGGEKVYCLEVEDALCSHPGVLEAAVVGIPDRVHGERVAAFVVPRARAAPEPDDLRSHVAQRLARYKGGRTRAKRSWVEPRPDGRGGENGAEQPPPRAAAQRQRQGRQGPPARIALVPGPARRRCRISACSAAALLRGTKPAMLTACGGPPSRGAATPRPVRRLWLASPQGRRAPRLPRRVGCSALRAPGGWRTGRGGHGPG